MARVPDRFPLLVDEQGDSCVDDALNAVRVTAVGGPASSVLVTDVQDGAGDSVMDAINDAVRVVVVAGGGLTDPQRTIAVQTTVAAGSSTALDSAQIASGKVGHLLQIVAASSVPFKAEVRTVQNGVASGALVVGFGADRNWEWTAVGRGFISVAQDPGVGLDAFRVVMTNLDPSRAADVYVTFFYDEV